MWANVLLKGAKAAVKAYSNHQSGKSKLEAHIASDAPRRRVAATYLGGGLDTSGGILAVTATHIHFQTTMGSSMFRTNELHVPLVEILGVEIKEHGFPWKRRCRLEVRTASKTHVFIVNDPDDVASVLSA